MKNFGKKTILYKNPNKISQFLKILGIQNSIPDLFISQQQLSGNLNILILPGFRVKIVKSF